MNKPVGQTRVSALTDILTNGISSLIYDDGAGGDVLGAGG